MRSLVPRHSYSRSDRAELARVASGSKPLRSEPGSIRTSLLRTRAGPVQAGQEKVSEQGSVEEGDRVSTCGGLTREPEY